MMATIPYLLYLINIDTLYSVIHTYALSAILGQGDSANFNPPSYTLEAYTCMTKFYVLYGLNPAVRRDVVVSASSLDPHGATSTRW